MLSAATGGESCTVPHCSQQYLSGGTPAVVLIDRPGMVTSSTLIDDFRGACAVKGNDAVAGHVKSVDHDDVR